MSVDKKEESHSQSEMHGLLIDQDKEYFNMIDVHIKSLDKKEPLNIDFYEELQHFLQANILRPFETQGLKMNYLNSVLDKRVAKMMKLCFWCIMCNRFPETVDILAQEELQKYYKRKISRGYMKIFQKLPQPKDEMVTFLAFTISFLIHFAYYKYFPPQREYFDFRFVLNCYHTVLYEFNGLFLSDAYIKMMIEKIFTHRFLDYEKKNMKELLQRQIELKKLSNRRFLGYELEFPDISSTSREGKQFQEKIMTTLKRDKRQIGDIKEYKSRNMARTMEGSGYFGLNRTRSVAQESGDASSTIQTSRLKERPSQTNLKLNCSSVSPTIGQLLEYNDLNLPFMKKKMIKHNFEKPDNKGPDLIAQMKEMISQDRRDFINKNKEVHVSQKGKNIIDQYDLRAPPKEYYQKYNKQNKMFKEMLDVNYVLSEQNDNFSQLPSSIDLLHLYNNKFANNIQAQNHEKYMKNKVEVQKKQLKIIENVKSESGNQDIFEMPFKGTRSEGRKLIAYVREKSRKQLEQPQIEVQPATSRPYKLNDQLPSIQSQKQVQPLQQIDSDQPPPLPSTKKFQIVSNLLNAVNAFKNTATSLNQKLDAQYKPEQESSSKIIKKNEEQIVYNAPLLTEDNEENHRKIISRIVHKVEQSKNSQSGSIQDYSVNRTQDDVILYEDKRQEYKNKYGKLFEKISTDQNINELCLNILQKRNMANGEMKQKS